jgi:GTP-binding protein HflX
MEELWSLVMSLGESEVVDALVQRADFPDRATYIGQGKVPELYTKVKEEEVDVIVINGFAKPGQLFNLQRKLYTANPQIQVWDRVDLILFIFSKHAHTAEAKLQIELARMRHMGPRIYGMGKVLSQQSAGIGTVGIGETNTELMKRHWREQMKKVQDQLQKLSEERQRQLERRIRVGLQTVSIVGYTNAGKTTLFNVLTHKHKKADNILFATLDSAVGKIYLPQSHREILVTDTIGFIKNLPPKLIEAFKSTLMESLHADLLIHVIDASDPDMEYKIFVVERILQELGVQNKERLYVFNKMDAVDGSNKIELASKYHEFSPQFISVKTVEGIDRLRETIDSLITPVAK